MNPYEIHQAIARNATLIFVEPGDDGITPVEIRKTCAEIIAQGITYNQQKRATNDRIAEMPIPSVDDMILDFIAVHWAVIEPPTEDERFAQES